MLNILVVEDDDLVAQSLELSLQSGGHNVHCAANGKEALSILENSTVDLVITDIIMPTMDGFELLSQLRKFHRKIPVIAISGGGRIAPDAYLITAEGLGATKVLNKPFKTDELLKAVEESMSPSPK